MRRFLSGISILLIATSALGASALAGSLDRAVRVDFAPIAGAKSYEVQWYEAPDCESKVGSSTVKAPVWGRKLPAGRYCLRVRAQGIGDRPGQWTEMQRFDVAPKPPATVTQATPTEWTWSDVDYAKKYVFEVADASGKVLYRETTSQTTGKLPQALQQDLARRPGVYKVQVRTEVAGLPPSVATESAFEVRMATAGVASAFGMPGDRRAPGATAGRDPASSMRMQVPIDPKNVLPDWRLIGGLGLQSGTYGVTDRIGGNNSTPQDLSQGVSGTKISGRFEYVPRETWGAYLRFEQAGYVIGGVGSKFTSFSAGPTINFDSNKRWGPRYTLGFGPAIHSGGMAQLDSGSAASSGPTWYLGLQTFGIEFSVSTLQGLSDAWAIHAAARYGLGLTQDQLQSDIQMKSSSYALELGPTYRLMESVWLQAVGFMGNTEFSNDAGSSAALSDKGFLIRGVIRTGPIDGRSPASVSAIEKDQLWKGEVKLPIGFRNQDFIFSPNASDLLNTDVARTSESVNPMGVEATLERKFSPTSPWTLGLTGSYRTFTSSAQPVSEQGLRMTIARETPLAGRPDLSLEGRFGLGLRQVAGGVSTGPGNANTKPFTTQLSAVEALVGALMQKRWNRSWVSEIQGNIARPIVIGDGSGGGTSWIWSAGVQTGYRMSSSLTVWLGYTLEQVRLSVRSTKELASGTSETLTAINSFQNQFSLGISFNW